MYYLFFPSIISQFPNFLLYLIFLYMGSMNITVHTMEACNKDYYYYYYYVNSNWSYSPEAVKLGFELCDLDI